MKTFHSIHMDNISSRGTLHIVIETHPVLGSCHVSIFVVNSGSDISRMSVTVEQSAIVLKFYSENELVSVAKLLLPDTKFVPLSCAGLTGVITPGGHFVSFKAKKSFADALEVNFHIQILNAKDSTSSNIAFAETPVCTRNDQCLNPVAHRCLNCRFCGFSLFSSPKSFRKVLELPSENWEELSSDWFCHKHEESPVASLLDTKEQCDSLYVSSLYYKLNFEWLYSVLQDSNELYCKRCHTRIGIVQDLLDTSNQVKTAVVLRSKVIFSEQFPDSTCCDRSEMDKFRILLNLIEKHISTAPSCKICFDCKPEQAGEKGTTLFLWVMDSRLHRYYRSLPISRTYSEHTLDVKLNSVVRVLFEVASRNSPQASTWRKDFFVEVEEVDQGTLLAFIKYLLDSTKSVPPSHRFIDKLMIGYIFL